MNFITEILKEILSYLIIENSEKRNVEPIRYFFISFYLCTYIYYKVFKCSFILCALMPVCTSDNCRFKKI